MFCSLAPETWRNKQFHNYKLNSQFINPALQVNFKMSFYLNKTLSTNKTSLSCSINARLFFWQESDSHEGRGSINNNFQSHAFLYLNFNIFLCIKYMPLYGQHWLSVNLVQWLNKILDMPQKMSTLSYRSTSVKMWRNKFEASDSSDSLWQVKVNPSMAQWHSPCWIYKWQSAPPYTEWPGETIQPSLDQLQVSWPLPPPRRASVRIP